MIARILHYCPQWIGGVILLAKLSITAATSAMAADKLVFSLWTPPTHPNTLAAKAWGERLAEVSKNRLTVQIVPAQELAPANEHLALVKSGKADIGHISIGQEMERLPIASISLLPLTIKQGSGGSRAFNEWYRRYAEYELKELKLCMAFLHDPGSLHTQTKLLQPDQIRGVKIRIPNPAVGRYIALLGGQAIQIPAAATYEALQQGNLDAIAFPWGSLFQFGLDRRFKHHIDFPLYTSSFLWVINEQRYRSLPADLRAILDAHCTIDEGSHIADEWIKIETAGRDRARITGDQQLHRLDTQDLAAWRRPAELMRADWILKMKTLKLDGSEMFDSFLAALIQYDAAF